MSVSRYSSEKDRTARRNPGGGGGGDMRLMWVSCGHKGARSGAEFKRGVPWRCAACVLKGKA